MATNNDRNFEEAEETPDGATLGVQMIDAMVDQTASMDNLAQSIDEFAKAANGLTEIIDKKLKLGSLLGGVFPGKKKTD